MDTNKFENIGIGLPKVLLPAKNVDMTKWSVVACDQYTSQPEYWSKVEDIINGEPSTYHLIFPEIYLEGDDREKRIQTINKNMKKYLKEGILISLKPGFIYVDRQTTHAESRKGLIICVDLEKYDYNKGSQSLIRATEGTVVDRLPPRVKIREHASIELPHIMLLIDDSEKTVIEPLSETLDKREKLYDFDLMMNGGHIKGYKIEDEETISNIVDAISRLADPDAFRKRYGVGKDKEVLLFAVGDGNHSLASAKVHWENVKKNLPKNEKKTHPARYALVELVNVHDEGIVFEPIHRVVFNVNVDKTLERMLKFFEKHSKSNLSYFDSKESLSNRLSELRKNRNVHAISFITKDKLGIVAVENPKFNLEVGTLQAFLDDLGRTDSKLKIDYIHGEDVVTSLGIKEGNIGFYLPSMNKHDLFKTVILEGVLPRKTFSMGEAEEKRFYLECRKIVR